MKKNLDNYKKFIKNLIVDKYISEEIISKIYFFNNHGTIKIEKNNLYGKINEKKNSDYLEIRYENNYLICNYTDWNSNKYINITQKYIKGKNTKIDRKEKIEYKCSNNDNHTTIEEIEKIYNSHKELAYESELKKDYNYNTYENYMSYNNNICFDNEFSLDKKWYINNGSIISYRLSKSYFNTNSDINEFYEICQKPFHDGFAIVHNYIELDKDLFVSFMTGNITIEELLEKVNNNNSKKL